MLNPPIIVDNLDAEIDGEEEADDHRETDGEGTEDIHEDNDDDESIESIESMSNANSDDEVDISSSKNMHGDLLPSYIGMDGEEYDDDDEDDDDDDYLQKFDEQLHQNIIEEYHPELIIHSNDDIQAYTRIVRNEKGQIIDPMHTSVPFVTKYERARVLGERAKQLNAGAKALIEVDTDVIDGYLIAIEEFKHRKIPFIVKRPMPNGGCEYWKLKDLEII
jgi:DNA-directed RNA polymerase I, II, and III subunit RPABC2